MTTALAHGVLDLRFARGSDGCTRIVRREHRYPLQLTVALRVDPAVPDMAFVYVQNPSGGIFADDVLDIDIVAEAGARVHVTTAAATKVYGMPDGVARQRTRISAHADAYVEYVPQLLIPQAQSSLDQSLEITLGPGAACVAMEGVAPGRYARGEAFAYERLALTTSVACVERGTLAVDAMLLEPRRRRPSARGLLGAQPYFGTLTCATLGRAEELAELLDGAVREQPDATAAAGTLPHACGATTRVLAGSSHALRRTLDAGWACARSRLIGSDLPWRPT